MHISDYIKEKEREILKGRLTSDDFQEFLRDNGEQMASLLTYYKCALMKVETKFMILNEEFSLVNDRNPIEAIKTRMKSMESIVEKVGRYGVPLSLESIEKNIKDIAGCRVICSFPEDIYTLANCVLQHDDITLIERKDYIKSPKESGYRSLHLIVSIPIFLENTRREIKVEIQFRTIAMDFWASLEHKLRYKKNLPADLNERLSKELVECAEMSAALDSKMEHIKNEITSDANEDDHTRFKYTY